MCHEQTQVSHMLAIRRKQTLKKCEKQTSFQDNEDLKMLKIKKSN